MDRSVFSHLIKVTLTLFIALFIAGCSNQTDEQAPESVKEPQTLNVTVLQVDGSPAMKAIEDKMSEYAAKDELLTVNVSAKSVSADAANADLQQAIQGADLVIFSSLLNQQFREQSNAFHPVPSNEEHPIYFPSAYAAKNASTNWASLIAIDPIVFVQKAGIARVAGFSDPMTDWDQLRVFTSLERSRGNKEAFWVFSEQESSIQDTWAAYFLAFNYLTQYNAPYSNWINVLKQAIIQDAESIYPDAVPESIASLPSVKNIKQFMQSSAYFAAMRYSHTRELNEEEQKSVYVYAFPNSNSNDYVCYAYAAAVPLNAANPDGAQQWIQNASQQSQDWAEMLGGVAPDAESLKKNLNISDQCRFLIRERKSSIQSETIHSIFNNDVVQLENLVLELLDDFYPPQNGA